MGVVTKDVSVQQDGSEPGAVRGRTLADAAVTQDAGTRSEAAARRVILRAM